MKLSNQAIGAVMLALQNSLATQSDILPVFQGWDLFIKDGEIFVDNPPVMEATFPDEEDDDADEVLDFLTSPDE